MKTFVPALLLFSAFAASCMPKIPPAGPPAVQVAKPVRMDVPIYDEWVGTLDGSVNAQLRAEVSGYLQSQNYRDGALVKKGDLLFQIDPRPFQAKLDQANAALGKTELDVKRLTPLAKESAVSQQELDDAVQANLSNLAAVEQARLNLEFTRIIAPISGIAAIATAQIGDLVGPSDEPLTVISQVDPIRAYFSVSEQDYLAAVKPFLDGDGGEGATPEPPTVELQLILAGDRPYAEKGRVVSVDREVDPRTGAIRLVGEFPNPRHVLRPGQFARVRAQVGIRKDALLVPQRAVIEIQGTYQLAVVKADNQASIRPVTMGERSGSLRIVASGIGPDDQVVVEGVQKAKDGVVVSPQPYRTPGPSAVSSPVL